jgi:hypothetical protein
MVINETIDKIIEFQNENELVLITDRLSDNEYLMGLEDIKEGSAECTEMSPLV